MLNNSEANMMILAIASCSTYATSAGIAGAGMQSSNDCRGKAPDLYGTR